MSYVVRAVNGSVVKVTENKEDAITTAVQFREMKLASGADEKDAHCVVEQKALVFSTRHDDKYIENM